MSIIERAEAAADAIKVRLLEGNSHGQIGEVISLSASVAKAEIEKGVAEIVKEAEAVA